MMIRPRHLATAFTATVFIGTALQAAPAPSPALHIRGTIQHVQGKVLSISTAAGPIRVQLPTKPFIVAVLPSNRAHIKDGTFLGIASEPGPSGTQRAREVVVFPESGRGTGEGSYAWDLPGGGTAGHSKMTNGTAMHSKMTNGTAAHSKMTNGTVHKSSGDALTLQYKSGTGTGSQNITLPANIPIVTFAPGQMSLLKPGAHVFIVGHHQPNGMTVADRVLVGKNGLVPPM
jgi:hypothetical protein